MTSRNCLECGTPKWAKRAYCECCETKTLSYVGVARRPLCASCRYYKPESDLSCARAQKVGEHRWIAKGIDKLSLAATKYSHQCAEYQRGMMIGWDDHKQVGMCDQSDPSPHPLSFVDREEIRMFLTDPSAFWFDPHRWDDIDPTTEKFWMKAKKPTVSGMLVGAAIIAVGLLAASIEREKV